MQQRVAVILADEEGNPGAVFAADTLAEVWRYASAWPHKRTRQAWRITPRSSAATVFNYEPGDRHRSPEKDNPT